MLMWGGGCNFWPIFFLPNSGALESIQTILCLFPQIMFNTTCQHNGSRARGCEHTMFFSAITMVIFLYFSESITSSLLIWSQPIDRSGVDLCLTLTSPWPETIHDQWQRDGHSLSNNQTGQLWHLSHVLFLVMLANRKITNPFCHGPHAAHQNRPWQHLLQKKTPPYSSWTACVERKS